METPPLSPEIEEVIVGLRDMILSRDMMAAAAAVLVYDWVLTLSTEVELLWKARWSSVKVIYFVNRYFIPLLVLFANYGYSGFGTIFTPSGCKIWITTDSFLLLSFFCGLHYIVTLRAWALWGKNKYLGFIVWGLFVTYMAATITLTSKVITSIPFIIAPIVNVCFGVFPDFLWAIWLPSIIYESLVFFLTAAKAFHHSRRNVETPILTVLYRDGFLYFVFISANSFLNLLFWALMPSTRIVLLKYFSLAICQVAGSHLILDLLKVGKKLSLKADTSSSPDKIRKLSPTTPPVSPIRTFGSYQFGNNIFEMTIPNASRSRNGGRQSYYEREETWDGQGGPYNGTQSGVQSSHIYTPRDRTSRTVQWSDEPGIGRPR